MTKVFVGMSGGVDSSLSAALLQEQGYDVTGVYMKNWTKNLPGMRCPWADDLADAKRVAVQLGIDFRVFDFETQYKQKVVDYMINEYKAGRTPNPDIMCNQEVKFKLFLETALEQGADKIAMGHYAQITYGSLLSVSSETASRQVSNRASASLGTWAADVSEETPAIAQLCKARDTNKDQTYFLYRVTGQALQRTLFPIGDYTKPTVRQMAKKRGLYTAAKKDSQGICFVGQVGIRDFLSQYVSQVPGKIIDEATKKTLGYHDGAIFYTIGQRHGLDLGGGLPYYVVGKDMARNEVYVTTDLNDKALWKNQVMLHSVHWINQPPAGSSVDIRVRHRAPLVQASWQPEANGKLRLSLKDTQRAIAAGQSVVIYQGDICLGGGIVA